ncbi:MAG: 2-oxo acid dehydrogenase subunit E2 [Planctomycetales bacterium]|nr:2-oxo acid dehydrogenase subunit E2 [Planctomycetales bacterium]
MAIDVKLPDLGDGIESGDVLEILVKEGDSVKKDQGLLELETDKATVTVPSPSAGKIVKITVTAGQTVAIGSVIAQLEADGAATAPSTAQTPSQPAPAPAEMNAAAQPVASAPVVPEAKPVVTQPTVPPLPTPIQAGPETPAPPQLASPLLAQASSESTDVAAGPAVRRFAREVGVDLTHVSGTGEGGRITRDDVLRAVRESNVSRTSAGTPAAVAESHSTSLAPVSPPVAAKVGGNKPMVLPGDPGADDYGAVRVERLSKIRKTIAAQMHKSWSTVPRVTNFDDADVTDLEAFRASSKDDYAAEGIKLTTMPFLIKAVATALRHHPAMNAVIDLEKESITYRDYVNVGIAVDTDRGLVVPNIRHADRLGVPDIARALADLAARVRTGDFGVNELRGGTFTISNLGAIGGTYSTPIVNVPEVAILLVGRTRKLPVVMEDDSIRPRLMMPLSLSYDHRLVDGGTAARFLNDVIAYLEAPSRLLLAIN